MSHKYSFMIKYCLQIQLIGANFSRAREPRAHKTSTAYFLVESLLAILWFCCCRCLFEHFTFINHHVLCV